MKRRTDSLEQLIRSKNFSISPKTTGRSNKYAQNIGVHPAFLSNSKRVMMNAVSDNTTPGPGNYAQYSSIHYPLIFPKGDNKDTYIVYENGRMTRKFQNYAVSKGTLKTSLLPKLERSPGPGSYDINISSFRQKQRVKQREKGKLIVCNFTSPSIPSNNIYDESSSSEDSEAGFDENYKSMGPAREIMDKLGKKFHSSFENDRFQTINDSAMSNRSLETERYIDNSFISRGKVIKVIHKASKPL